MFHAPHDVLFVTCHLLAPIALYTLIMAHWALYLPCYISDKYLSNLLCVGEFFKTGKIGLLPQVVLGGLSKLEYSSSIRVKTLSAKQESFPFLLDRK